MKDYKHDSSAVLARFGKDRRATTAAEERDERPAPRRPRISRDNFSERRSGEQREAQPRRRSYNPNFDSDNRPLHETPRRTHENGDRTTPYREHREYGEYREHRDYRDDRRAEGRDNRDNRKPFGGRSRSFAGEGETSAPRRSYTPHSESGHGRKTERKPRFGEHTGGAPKKSYQSRPKAADKPRTYPKYNPEEQTGEMRLNRFLAQSGLCSRREADDYITAGLVTVNGTVVTELGTKVLPTDEVRFNDETVRGEKKVYLVLNKPKGYVTTLDDPHASKTVLDLVKNACTERIYPVGRLDKNSLGLLLFTNDGDLAKQLTHPSYQKKKIYQVSLDKPLTRSDMERIADGITLEDGEIYADEIAYVKEDKKEIGIEIHSGRNRIVRRIFEHLGYTVQKLDRVYYAGLTKKNLKRGGWRFLTREEVIRLKSGLYD